MNAFEENILTIHDHKDFIIIQQNGFEPMTVVPAEDLVLCAMSRKSLHEYSGRLNYFDYLLARSYDGWALLIPTNYEYIDVLSRENLIERCKDYKLEPIVLRDRKQYLSAQATDLPRNLYGNAVKFDYHQLPMHFSFTCGIYTE